MADNTGIVNAAGSTETFATDDIGGVKYPRAKLTWGADGSASDASTAAPIPVVQASTATFGYSASATFASATTASTYAANDVYSTYKSFALGAPSGGRIMITSATFEIDTSATEATAWKLRLHSATPDSSIADNGAFDISAGDRATYLGSISLGTPTDEGSTLYSEVDGINKQIKLSGTGVTCYLTNVSSSTAITTADHIVTIHAVGV